MFKTGAAEKVKWSDGSLQPSVKMVCIIYLNAKRDCRLPIPKGLLRKMILLKGKQTSKQSCTFIYPLKQAPLY
jgi:hypothetical protein